MVEWRVPLFDPDITADDEAAVLRPLRDKWLTMGEATREFESAFAEHVNVKHAFAVSSCTAALHLSVLALDLEPGDEVLVPSLTFCGCANVIRAAGATPVFVDIASKNDWTLSPDDLKAKLTPRSKAFMAVHYAGFACQTDALMSIAESHGMALIEDCAHALFTRVSSRACGTNGAAGCFSFFTNKNMSTGEGGMFVTNDDELAEKVRLLRSHGMSTLTLDRHQGRAVSYDVLRTGLNYRIDEMRARLGLSQLKRLEANLEKRRAVYRAYLERLNGIEGFTIPFSGRKIDEVGIHIFPVALDSGINRAAFIQAMKERGIQTSIHYPAVHLFSAYADFREAACPLTEDIASREVTLPFYPHMSAADLNTVIEALRESLRIAGE